MIDNIEKVYKKSKKGLETLLRERAYLEIENALKEKGIKIDDVNDEDIESLLASSVDEMKKSIKGFGAGALASILFSLAIGG